jgi:PKD repeat protein
MNSKTLIILCIGILFLIFPVSAVNYGFYTIPIMCPASSPQDAVTTYMGMLNVPNASMGGVNRVYIPTTGIMEDVVILDNSTTAGTNQAYTYYIRVNDATDYLVKQLSVTTSTREFTNYSFNIPVTAGDYFEVKRVHPTWTTNPTVNIVGGYVTINATAQSGYGIPVVALANAPADSVTNYIGWMPRAPTTTQNSNLFLIPSGGNITSAYILDNSTTVSTNENYNYFVQTQNRNDTLIAKVTTTAGLKVFSNAAMSNPVTAGGFLEVKRTHPAWTTNPTSNNVSGIVFVDTSLNTVDVPGYPIFVQALTGTVAKSSTYYFGNKPAVVTVTALQNKIYIPKTGMINKTFINVYSGTPGTSEIWSLYIRKNGATDYKIATLNTTSNTRIFNNNNMQIPVAEGDYIEIKGVTPAFAVQPATTTYSGYVFVDYGPVPSTGGGGGDIILPPVSNFSANVTSIVAPATVKFFDQSNNTIPTSTLYKWNFTDGGVTVDSTDANPTFTYTASGTYTINHTVSDGSTVSKNTKTITITSAGVMTGPPNSSFVITLTDTSTNVPTSWKWNKTSLLGDNIETTFSTSQNPVFNFPTGNYLINLTTSNAIGSNSTNQTIGWNLSSPKVYFWSRTA